MKRVALLGATGSIGRQAHRDHRRRIRSSSSCAVAAGSTRQELDAGSPPARGVATSRSSGDPPLDELSRRAEPDVVLNAVVGFAGLPATLTALEAGIDLALANKESLVAAGDLALGAPGAGRRADPPGRQRALGAVPVPRRTSRRDASHALVLTASGGPFRGRSRATSSPTSRRSDALAHPTWNMGPKITIDSATLMNKGLELIEAHFLFGHPVRADRGGRPPDLDRPLARSLPRRRRARSPRLPRHAGADLVRPHLSGARGDADRAARPRGGARRSSSMRPTTTRSPAWRSPARPAKRRDRALRPERGERGRRRGVPRRRAAVPGDRRGRRADAGRGRDGARA